MLQKIFALTATLIICGTLPTNSMAALSGSAEAGKLADRSATLNRFIAAHPRHLNPIMWSLAVEANILGTSSYAPVIFDRLLIIDPDTGELACWLCEKYEISKDKKSVTFSLVKTAKFHDGNPLTAEDVKFSFDVSMHPKVDNLNIKSGLLDAISDVQVLDPYTLKVNFKSTKFMNIYDADVSVVPKHLFPYFEKNPENFNKDNKFNRAPLGSGPYKFKEWNSGKGIEVERNEDWWGFKDPRFANLYAFQKIRFKVITDDNVALQAFLKGEFDYSDLPSFNFKKVKELDPKTAKVEALHFVPKINASYMFIALNNRLPKFKDVRTRHALALLTDRFSTLQKFSMGLRPPTNGPWGVNSPYSCPQTECPIIPFDVEKAKKLLAEAGWKDTDKDGVLDMMIDGKKEDLRFTIMADTGDYSKNVLGVYSTEMKKAGVDMQLKLLDWTAMMKIIDDLNFEAYLSGFGMGYPISPRQLWHSENTKKTGSNSWAFVNKKADELIEKFEGEFNDTKRAKIGAEIHKLIYNDHPVIFHHEGGGCLFGINKELKGVELAQFNPNCLYWPRWYKPKKG